MTKAAALEYADKRVRINAVAPVVIHTPLAERAGLAIGDAQMAERVLAMHPIGRIGAPDEVAQAVLRLCSKGASFTTGRTPTIDGGSLI